jgi:hypothetical protein
MTQFLEARSLWWDGRMRTGEALRLSGGQATPVPLTAVPQGVPRRRFPGTLLPGLLDAHVHSGLVDVAVLRAGGIGSVWDLGSVPDRVAALARRAVDSGAKLPRIRFAGPFLIAPGGYPSDREWAAPGSWRTIDSAARAGDVVCLLREAGATLIKVTAHAGGPRLPLSALTALVEAAHDAGLPVVVHAEGAGTVAEAYESGADMLAHTPWTESLDPGLIKACAERMRWISTLDIHGWGVPTPEQTTAIGNLRRFLEYGGSVRYGTDLGNGPLPPAVNPREIRALQSAGLNPDEILTAMADDGVTWIPGGLDLEPTRFADVMATARVLDDDVRPRLTEETA